MKLRYLKPPVGHWIRAKLGNFALHETLEIAVVDGHWEGR